MYKYMYKNRSSVMAHCYNIVVSMYVLYIYHTGWIVKLKVEKDCGYDELMSVKDYEQHVVESSV